MKDSIILISNIIRKAIVLSLFLILASTAQATIINANIEGTEERERVEEIIPDFRETLTNRYDQLDQSDLMIIVHITKFKDERQHGLSIIRGSVCHVFIEYNHDAGRWISHEFFHVLYSIEHPEYNEEHVKKYAGRSGERAHDDFDPSGPFSKQGEKEYRLAKAEIAKNERIANREAKRKSQTI